MSEQNLKETVRAYGEKFADSLYNLSVYSILAYSGALALMLAVGVAVAAGLVTVPEFHPT